ncbi:hypothetical protein AB1N83_001026 [Pleurotus pulmonarius]
MNRCHQRWRGYSGNSKPHIHTTGLTSTTIHSLPPMSTSETRCRVFIEAVQIRLKSADVEGRCEAEDSAPTKTTSFVFLGVDGAFTATQKDGRRSDGCVEWRLQTSIELHTNSRSELKWWELRTAGSDSPGSQNSVISASADFGDLYTRAAADRNWKGQRILEFHREHDAATLTLCVQVQPLGDIDERLEHEPPIYASEDRDFSPRKELRQVRPSEVTRVAERAQMERIGYATIAWKTREPDGRAAHDVDGVDDGSGSDATLLALDRPSPLRIDSTPVNSGRVQYAVVGTRRPKPR